MNIQFVIDLAFRVSLNFHIEQREGNSILVKFENEEVAVSFVEEISVYEEFSVVRNENEVLVRIL
jgi:hypothetical protein